MGPSVTAVTSTSPERWCLPWGERTTQTALSAASASKEWVFLHVDLNVGRQIVKQTDWLSQAVKVIKSYLDSHSSCKSILGSSLSEISNKFRRRDQTKKKRKNKIQFNNHSGDWRPVRTGCLMTYSSGKVQCSGAPGVSRFMDHDIKVLFNQGDYLTLTLKKCCDSISTT